jgi:hypothetical protein
MGVAVLFECGWAGAALLTPTINSTGKFKFLRQESE